MPMFPEWWYWDLTSPHPWIVIVEPDVDAKLLFVVTVYEVSE